MHENNTDGAAGERVQLLLRDATITSTAAPMTLHWHDVVPHFFNPGIGNQFSLFFHRFTCERRAITITLSLTKGFRARAFLPEL